MQTAIEAGLKSILDFNHPELGSCAVMLSLRMFKNESQALAVISGNDVTVSALRELGSYFVDGKYADLPPAAYAAYKNIYETANMMGCEVEFIHKGSRLWSVSPNMPLIKLENVLMEFDIVLYGRLLKIGSLSGGDLKLRAWLQLIEGNMVCFEVTEDQANALSVRLFEIVALNGKALCNVATGNTVGFKFYGITNYRVGRIGSGFQQLRELTAGFWDGFMWGDDIEKFLSPE